MISIAKAMTDEEIKAAAEYFAKVSWSPWIRVVEAKDVPRTRIAGSMHVPTEGMEPLGQRIIEMPEDRRRTELRDASSGFVAYVPKGSVARGEALATRGQCAFCHGDQLKGLGPVPGIAGRSPSYIVRQLYDMQAGTRKGLWSELMKSTVGPMSQDEMLAVAAYVASRAP